MQQQFQQPDQTTVRPALRVLGAVVLFILTLVFAADAFQLLTATTPTFRPDTCSGKGRVVCELGNWLSAAIPDPIQVPLEIASRIVLALLSLYVAVRLMLPRRFVGSLKKIE